MELKKQEVHLGYKALISESYPILPDTQTSYSIMPYLKLTCHHINRHHICFVFVSDGLAAKRKCVITYIRHIEFILLCKSSCI